MVRDCLALSVDISGTAITYKRAMFDPCVFWEM